jgi:hypothetical protein
MEGKAIRGKEADEDEMVDEGKPAEVSRFMDDEELEDDELLGESTLKHMGSKKGPKASDEDEDDEDLEEEPEVQSGGSEAPEKAEEEAEEEVEEAEEDDSAEEA